MRLAVLTKRQTEKTVLDTRQCSCMTGRLCLERLRSMINIEKDYNNSATLRTNHTKRTTITNSKEVGA